MASFGLNFSNITPDNGAVRDLSQVIMASIVAPERLGGMFNIFPDVHDGDKLAIIGEFGLVGKANTACTPTYGTDTIATSQKEWDIIEWQVAEGICYKDLESTFVKYMLKSKTSVADATSNEYMDMIVRPRLEVALYKMMFRIAWFGDTAADTTANSGILKIGTDKTYFNMTDGIWKQLYTIGTGDATRVVTISANSQATFAAQKSAIMTSGVATGIMNSLITGASPKLREANRQVIYITLGLKDALDFDLQQNNKGSELQWRSLFNGIQETTYQGIRLVAVPLFDEIIQTYEGTTTAWNKPYRAVYTTEENLLLGVGGTDTVADIRIWFDQTDQMNYILAKDRIGALVAQNDLVQMAY